MVVGQERGPLVPVHPTNRDQKRRVIEVLCLDWKLMRKGNHQRLCRNHLLLMVARIQVLPINRPIQDPDIK
ncbi:hypothetical protein TRIUR3_19167 [Triticum urartu]|uniref:Uncharacterized protein n=1 Tax=Triticum urartu TaxID=4572 RepID=M7YJY9_TRIUA|nr:hypothetical protein TRIUR3_19167 [Triticum urartu]